LYLSYNDPVHGFSIIGSMSSFETRFYIPKGVP
jgi:hypothetical protein